jgi:hypothetical protein
MSTTTLVAPKQQLLAQAKHIFSKIAEIESRMLSDRGELLSHAWLLGAHLDGLKDQVGHGNWYLWLDANLRELGNTEDMRRKNAERCMKFLKENPNPKNSSDLGANYRPPADFTAESVRKFMWGYVPVKERLQLEGDEDVNPQPHYLTFVNQYSKWRRQVKIGHVDLPPLALMRRDFEPTVRDLIDLLGRDWIAALLLA